MTKNILLLILSLFFLSYLNSCSPQNNDELKAQPGGDESKQNPVCQTIVNKTIKRTDKWVINFFCGKGCIPCNKVAPIVKAVAKKYKFKLNTYEVWYDDKNRDLLLAMAKERNTVVQGVPVVIIENDVYLGVEKINRLEELIQKYLK